MKRLHLLAILLITAFVIPLGAKVLTGCWAYELSWFGREKGATFTYINMPYSDREFVKFESYTESTPRIESKEYKDSCNFDSDWIEVWAVAKPPRDWIAMSPLWLPGDIFNPDTLPSATKLEGIFSLNTSREIESYINKAWGGMTGFVDSKHRGTMTTTGVVSVPIIIHIDHDEDGCFGHTEPDFVQFAVGGEIKLSKEMTKKFLPIKRGEVTLTVVGLLGKDLFTFKDGIPSDFQTKLFDEMKNHFKNAPYIRYINPPVSFHLDEGQFLMSGGDVSKIIQKMEVCLLIHGHSHPYFTDVLEFNITTTIHQLDHDVEIGINLPVVYTAQFKYKGDVVIPQNLKTWNMDNLIRTSKEYLDNILQFDNIAYQEWINSLPEPENFYMETHIGIPDNFITIDIPELGDLSSPEEVSTYRYEQEIPEFKHIGGEKTTAREEPPFWYGLARDAALGVGALIIIILIIWALTRGGRVG